MVLGLGACDQAGSTSVQGQPSGQQPGQAAVSATPSPEPAVTFSPESGATKVRPDAQVVVTAEKGRLESVNVRTAAGKVLDGELEAAGDAWRSSGILATGSEYTVTAVAVTEDGEQKTETSTFTTLKPTSTIGVEAITPGDRWTVGVGMPIMIQFAGAVKDREAVEKTLTVKTTPEVEGGWHWMNSRQIWWRPKVYWPSGTKVEMTAALNGAEFAKGVWGRRTYSTKFTIGSAVVSTVDVKKHTITVVKDGKLVRTIPVTTGLPTAKYRTRNGTKVIMDKKPVETMDAASTGTEKDDPEYYNLTVKWAMRLTWSGEYIHAAPWSVGQQGRANVSHGCTGMSTANAKWMFDFSKIGDVVVYKNSPRSLEPGNGYTAWEHTWATWVAGSALASPSASPSVSSSGSPSSSSGSSSSGSSSSTGSLTPSSSTGTPGSTQNA
jgi:lipoprotein-anchoring transpeptidase ErfK/SrfK